MGKVNETLEKAVEELEHIFAGRLSAAIEVKYGSIHLQFAGNLTSDDVDAVQRALHAHAQKVQRWRVQQVNNMLLLSVATENSDQV